MAFVCLFLKTPQGSGCIAWVGEASIHVVEYTCIMMVVISEDVIEYGLHGG